VKGAQWAEERQAKIARAKELLANGVRALQTSDDWRALLERIARNAQVRYRVSRYSFMNQMLVWSQAPDAMATAGYKQWQAAGRQVRKGEKGILIVQPRPWTRAARDEEGNEVSKGGLSFGTVSVFDVAQTEGPPLDAPPPLCATLAPDAVFAFGCPRLYEVALGLEGQPVSSIDVRARREGDPARAKGWYVPGTRAIVVIDDGNPSEMFNTLSHELGHAILHGTGEHHNTATKEVEAESVAFIVCHAVGLDTSSTSFPYVAHWAGSKDAGQAVVASGDRIARAANLLLDALHGAANATSESEAA